MMMNILATNEILVEVEDEGDTFMIWRHLKNIHETQDKGREFLLNNMLSSIKMEEHDSLRIIC
jgi:hypothetical protein